MFHYVNRFLSHVFSVNCYFYAHFYLYVFAYKDSILFFCFYFRRYISVCRVSVSVKYTLLGVLNLCYPNNVFENIKTDVKIGIFPILITYWSGFGIFKQNRENPNEIRIVGQSGSKNRCCPLQGRWFMNYIQVTALFYPLNQWFSFDHNHYFDRD